MPNASPPSERIAAAWRLLASGDTTGAEQMIAPLLAANASDPGVLMVSATLKKARGDAAGAIAAMDQAVAAAPGEASIVFNRANMLLEFGRYGEAVSGYDAALALRPGHPQTLLHRAYALVNTGRYEEALAGFAAAEAHALAPYALHYDKGRALASLGRPEAALASFDAALRLAPDRASAHFNRARALQDLDRPSEALAAYDQAAALSPDDADIRENRGVALADLNRLGEALTEFAAAEALRPDRPSTFSNRGLTLFAMKRPGEAIAAFDRAIALEAGAEAATRASFAYNRAMASLATHDFAAGWAGFAQRWRAGLVSSPPHDLGEPAWRGQTLDGALRIWPEQGIGDEVLFARFAPLARERTPDVVLESAERLVPLFARSFEGVAVRGVGAVSAPAGAQIAAGDIAGVLGVSRVSGAAYLSADPAQRDGLRARYEAIARGRLIVGIAWVSKSPRRGPYKSAALADWGALLRRDALFVNLQYGAVADEVRAAEAAFGCTIHRDASVDQIADLDAFAAQIAAMDQIVSVSNTTVHMAGALGVPCIVMVAPARGRLWYWGLDGERTPWYDSVRIVRRDLDADWASQVAAAASLLA